MSAEKFEESPIIYGDFIKMGAAPADRLYEEMADHKKLCNVLNEVKGLVIDGWIDRQIYRY